VQPNFRLVTSAGTSQASSWTPELQVGMPGISEAFGTLSSASVPMWKLWSKPAVLSTRKRTLSPGVTGISVICSPSGFVKRSCPVAWISTTRASPAGALPEGASLPAGAGLPAGAALPADAGVAAPHPARCYGFLGTTQ